MLQRFLVTIVMILTCEHDKAVVNWALDHFVNLTDVLYVSLCKSTYGLALFKHARTCLVHLRVQLLPGLSSISGSVYGASIALDEDDFIGVTAPHDVLQR